MNIVDHVHPPFYAGLISEIKQRIRQSQTRAILAANAELIQLYWDIGRLIDRRQKDQGWGSGVIPKLALDLKNELPEEKGFSERNIKRMLAFYREYHELNAEQRVIAQDANGSKVPQAAAQIPVATKVPQAGAQFTPALLFAIPWMHHAALMEKVKDFSVRYWYMQAIINFGWSRSVLVMQIETKAHERQGKAVTNFSVSLPPRESDLVQQVLKDPYIFDFLTLTEPFHERELETGLVLCLEKFLLELGQGFAFVGRQYHLDIGEQDFYIDLLFYHLKLRCYIVIELKRGAFKPEYAGKINFYCNLVDDQLRHASDKPTIGLILCQTASAVTAEYALRGLDKPIGVSAYELTRALPKELASSLPSIEDIERELDGKMAQANIKN
jgi:predicted nuclease of restriction endonuclease-like (RecB) superfamily